MEKKLISVHAVTVHIYTIAIVLLIVLLGLLGLKYLHLKWAVSGYTNSTIWMNQQEKPTGQISDYGLIVAQASQSIAPADLQTFVSNLSTKLNRDIVVLDKNKKIVADTFVANKGGTYSNDQGHVIDKTMQDGQIRTFVENSTDYQKGILEVVVPITDSKGQYSGAVLISNATVK